MYIASESGRFQKFVANIVSLIRSHSEVAQWKYVKSYENPADLRSGGSSGVSSFMEFTF